MKINNLVLSWVLGTSAINAQDVKIVPLPNNDMVYVSTHDRLYLTTSSTSSHGNSLCIIYPYFGTIDTCIFLGSEPNVMALTEDEKFIYIGMLGSPEIVKFDVEENMIETRFSLGSDPFFGANLAEDIVVLPGTNHSIIVSLMNTGISPRHRGVVMYDNGVARAKMTQEHTGSNILTTTPYNGKIYGYNNETTEFGFRNLIVSDSGLTEGYVYSAMINGFGTNMEAQDSFIYSSLGQVLNVNGDTPRLVGKYDVFLEWQSAVEPAIDSNVVYFITLNHQNRYNLYTFDKSTFLQMSHREVQGTLSGVMDNLIQWGYHGKLAVNTSDGVMILRNCTSAFEETLTLDPGMLGGCYGDTVILQAPTGYSVYFWSNGGVGLTTEVVQEGDYFFQVPDDSGCLSAPSNAVHIGFEFPPSQPYAFSESDEEICLGETINLIADGGALTKYQWSTGDTTRIINISEPGKYHVLGYTQFGCESPISNIINITQLTDSIPTTPALNISDTTICQGSIIHLVAPGGYQIYEWSNGNTSQDIDVDQSETVMVRVGNNPACLASSDMINVNVMFTPDQPFISANGSLLASSHPEGNQWFLNGLVIEGATEQFHEATISGFYSVQVTINGCSSAPSALYNQLTTATGEITAEKSISIYPNPTSGLINISQNGYEKLRLEVFDLTGRYLISKIITQEEDLSDLVAGNYLVKLSSLDYSDARTFYLSKI